MIAYVRFVDVARGRGVDGRPVADDVTRCPTAAASGGGPPGMPLSERGNLDSTWCDTGSKVGKKLICPLWSIIPGSIWPPGALRETPSRRELSDPIPPSTPSPGQTGAQLASAAWTRASPQP